MRLAHIAIATPRKCGLYETTRELVAAERALGVDARIVDPKPVPGLYPGDEDRGVPLADMEWATKADVIVSHSGHDGTPVADTDQPIIHVAHGRPLHSWLGEHEGGTPVYSYNLARAKMERYVACVTFWPEHAPIWQLAWGSKPVYTIPAPVDTTYWSPGPNEYDFAGKGGDFNVVMTDPWCRRDVVPFALIHAFALFRQQVPGAKLHLYAVDLKNLKGVRPLLAMLGDGVGVVQGWAADLRPVYRAADMLLTPHGIATRSVREAMACGVQVLQLEGDSIKAQAKVMEAAHGLRRSKAEHAREAARRFSMSGAGERMAMIAGNYARATVGY